MKNFSLICTLAAGVLISGCATHKGNLTFATVGPVQSDLKMPDAATGTLVVYSAFKRNADFDTSDPTHPEHSDYKILNTDGSLARNVHNVTKTVFEDAVPVSLSPGKYEVVARANGYGFLTIPVRVDAGQKTVVHLEGGGFWPDDSVFNETNAVRLPDGQVIGWKSTQD
jgi:hypothetical protein